MIVISLANRVERMREKHSSQTFSRATEKQNIGMIRIKSNMIRLQNGTELGENAWPGLLLLDIV